MNRWWSAFEPLDGAVELLAFVLPDPLDDPLMATG